MLFDLIERSSGRTKKTHANHVANATRLSQDGDQGVLPYFTITHDVAQDGSL